ncbi:MAG TPA: Hsp20/alpha crystallin family protein [Desulfomonilaceae bacterium]|nr:Hsp20/alpha crystallin family protein [Desulfomonilaceae bacterium]
MVDLSAEVTDLNKKGFGSSELTTSEPCFTPAADIYEGEGELVIVVDLPGVGLDGVELDLEHNILSIVGKVTPDVERGRFLSREFRPGDFFRAFAITKEIDRNGVAASLVDGVLKIVLPKIEKAVPRKIPVSCVQAAAGMRKVDADGT